MFALIARSRPEALPGLTVERRVVAETPWGKPSSPLLHGRLGGVAVIVLPRHGEDHAVPPHRINYRANIRALSDAGVEGVAAIATVGGIRDDWGPGTLVVPDQIIDYTSDRPQTFFDGESGAVRHIDFTWPFSATLRQRLLRAARASGVAMHDGGCYGCTNGPRLESAAEITRMKRDGCDVVGQTAMPEAALARELDLPYAAINIVVNHAAGQGDSAQAIAHDALREHGRAATAQVARVLAAFVAAGPDD